MTEEHKKLMAEGRKRAKEERKAGLRPPISLRGSKRKTKRMYYGDKNHPIIHITGQEKDAMDFFGPVKDCFRRLHRHLDIPPILREITHMETWANPAAVIRVLEKYATIEIDEDRGILISKKCLEGMDKAMEEYEKERLLGVEAKMLDNLENP